MLVAPPINQWPPRRTTVPELGSLDSYGAWSGPPRGSGDDAAPDEMAVPYYLSTANAPVATAVMIAAASIHADGHHERPIIARGDGPLWPKRKHGNA